MIKDFADWLVFQTMNLVPGTMLGEAVNFFVYDTIKIYLLLAIIVFAVALLRSYFSPQRARKLLSNKREYVGNILAALLGIVTPFCSCSAVPLFIGFLESGLPLGVTFSFLISAPTVNEVALVMLWGLFGWKIALLYVATGVMIAVISGIMIGKMNLEHLVEEYVYQVKLGEMEETEQTFQERIQYAKEYTVNIFKRVGVFVLLGVGLGAWIHGYVPIDLIVKYAGADNPFAVIIAVLLAIPLYSNAAGTIPIVQALVEKGMPLGTALAFMMAIVAISIPEMVILRKVIKPKLMAIFAGVVTTSIIFIGYLFNTIL